MSAVIAPTMHVNARARTSVAKSTFSGSLTPLTVRSAAAPRPARGAALVVRAERGPGFWSGFVVGGVMAGVLGYVFAPQISRAILGDDQGLRLPRFLEEQEDQDPEITKQNLADKIAQLNAAIDDVSAQLRTQESAEEVAA